MIRKVQTYIEANHLLAFDKPVIVGFSGGGDSVSLLYILNRLNYKCVAAHCNFQLRGDESNNDEIVCRKFAEKYQIPIEITHFETVAYAKKQQLSIEMAARELRYEWFEALRRKHDAQAIAVAHHQDDSNETLLLNLIRGTGIRGLTGIRPKNGWVVRPLLCLGREEITAFLKKQNLSFVTDSTNLSEAYTRNFIRLRLMPLMKKINPSVNATLARTAAHIAEAEIVYLQAIEQLRSKLVQSINKEEFRISIKEVLQQPAPQTVLYELLQSFGFTRPVAEDVFRALTCESGKRFQAPNSGYELLKDREFLFLYQPNKYMLYPDNTTNNPEDAQDTYLIDTHSGDLSSIPIRLSMHKVEIDASFKIDKSPVIATLDYDKLLFPLTLRKWKAGDWFVPFGMKGHKKLSDFFSDEKFSRLDKEKTWLLCSGNDIVWIVGKRIDNRFGIDNQTKYAFIINFWDEMCDY